MQLRQGVGHQGANPNPVEGRRDAVLAILALLVLVRSPGQVQVDAEVRDLQVDRVRTGV